MRMRQSWKRKEKVLGDMKTEGGASLNAGIALSLESLEVEFSQCVAEHSLETDYTVSDLYTSLCVLSNQAWIPVSVLGRCGSLKKMLRWMLRCCFAT